MKPPPPMLPADRVRDRERERDGDRRVDGVAAGAQDLDAGVGRLGRVARDHPVRAAAEAIRSPTCQSAGEEPAAGRDRTRLRRRRAHVRAARREQREAEDGRRGSV